MNIVAYKFMVISFHTIFILYANRESFPCFFRYILWVSGGSYMITVHNPYICNISDKFKIYDTQKKGPYKSVGIARSFNG